MPSPLPPGVAMPTPTDIPIPPATGWTPPPIIPAVVATPVANIWDVRINRSAPGVWAVTPDPAMISDGIGTDHIHFRLEQGFVPSLGPLPQWKLFIIFGANPWGLTPQIAFEINHISPFFMSPPIPQDPFPTGIYAFSLVLVEYPGGTPTVTDVFDPILTFGEDITTNVPKSIPDHFVCYKAREYRKRFPLFGKKRKVIVENQFGTFLLKVDGVQCLCVPSYKFDLDRQGQEEPHGNPSEEK